MCICVCAHSCTCTHALPPGGRCSRAPAGVPTVLVSWGPLAFAVNGELPRARGRVWRMWCLGHDTRVLLLGQDRAPGSASQPSGSPVSQAWDTLAFSSCAPRQPQALRSGYLALSLLLALGTQARRGPEPLPQGEGGGVPSLGLLLPPPPHLESTPVRDARRGQAACRGRWKASGKTWGACSHSKTTALGFWGQG